MAEDSGNQDKVQYKNVVLNNNTKNTKLGLCSLTGAVIVLCSVGCEIGKQISNYSINYYNGGSYPLPQTIMVVLLEALKLTGTFLRSGCRTPMLDKQSIRASFKFMLKRDVSNLQFLGSFLIVGSIVMAK